MNANEPINLKDKQQPTIFPQAIFGMRNDLRKNVVQFSPGNIAYLAGNYIVLYKSSEKKQYFVPVSPDYGEITAFDVDEVNDREVVVVFAQKEEKSAIFIKFFQFVDKNFIETKSKRLVIDDMDNEDTFKCIAICRNYIIAYMGYKNDKVLLFQNTSQSVKFVTAENSNEKSLIFSNIAVNFFSTNLYFCLYGEQGFCCYYVDQEKKAIVKGEPNYIGQHQAKEKKIMKNYVSACWISKTRLALLSFTSDVLIVDYFKDFEHPFFQFIKFENIFSSELKTKALFTRDFALYCVREDGLIAKLTEQQNKERINYEKDLSSPKFVSNLPRMEVHHACVSSQNLSKKGGLVISTTDNQLYFNDISSENCFTDGKNYKLLFEMKFHTKEITFLDIAKRKKLVATCGKDKFIKIWNYFTQKLECEQMFDEEPQKLAFHPNGLHLAVTFLDKVRLMNILQDKIEIYKEILIPNPLDIKFSNFGTFFSVSSRNGFKIFNFFTNDQVRYQFVSDGHSDNVTDIVWDQEDVGFATCGQDRKVFYWSLLKREDQDKTVTIKHVNPSQHPYQRMSIINQEDFVKVLAINHNELVEINADEAFKNSDDYYNTSSEANKKKMYQILLEKEGLVDFTFDQETKIIIMGLKENHKPSIIMGKFTGFKKITDIQYFQANTNGVNCLKTSHDMSFLFSCGSDNCLMIFNCNNAGKADKKEETHDQELVLVKKDELDKQAEELQSKLARKDEEISKAEKEFKKIKEEKETEEKMILEQIREEEETAEKELARLNEMIEEETTNYRLKKVEKEEEFNQEIQRLAEEHERKMNEKNNDYLREQDNYEKEKIKEDNYIKKLQKELQKKKEQIRKNYDQEIEKLSERKNELEQKKTEMEKDIKDRTDKEFSENNKDIDKKRGELDVLRSQYERNKFDFEEEHASLEEQLAKKKANLNDKESDKDSNRADLTKLQATNEKLAKQIAVFA